MRLLLLYALFAVNPLIHSSVEIVLDETVIQVDPWSAGDLSRARAADLILVTDDPIHHLDPKAIRQLRKPGGTVLIPAASHAKFPEGTAIANGEKRTIGNLTVEAIPAYDIKPGEPSHPKGKANGYLISGGGKRIYVAGVTECVPEVRALRDIDVAFVPMNLPLERMTPEAAAECVNAFKPRVVYVYHYDQTYASSGRPGSGIPESLEKFRHALIPGTVEFKPAPWYPR